MISEALFTHWTNIVLGHENTLGLVMHSLLLYLKMFRVQQSLQHLRSPPLVQLILQTRLEEMPYSTDRYAVGQYLQYFGRVYSERVLFQKLQSSFQIRLYRVAKLRTRN